MKKKPTQADVEKMQQAAERAEAELDAMLANRLVTREVAPLIRQFEADGDALAQATELRIQRAVEGVADPAEAERIADRLTADSLEKLEGPQATGGGRAHHPTTTHAGKLAATGQQQSILRNPCVTPVVPWHLH